MLIASRRALGALTALGLSLSVTCAAAADECRITAVDSYLGVDTAGAVGGVGVSARVDAYDGDGLLATLGGDGVAGVAVDVYVIAPGVAKEWYVGSDVSDGEGRVQVPLADHLRRDGDTFTFSAQDADGAPVSLSLTGSAFLQVIARAPEGSPSCDGGIVHPDVYGTAYFRHPDDFSPVLFTDLDDTLFDSADVTDIFRELLIRHYLPLDSAVVAATHTFRSAGGVLLGITAQAARQRPLTRSELLFWGFDDAYEVTGYHYEGAGYDGRYLPRTLSYLANNDYGDGHDRDGCAFKVEKLHQLVDGVFGGQWGEMLGFIGDTQETDGCSAFETGLHWYALMEGDDTVYTSGGEAPAPSPAAYTEIHGGWSEALPLVCADAGLSCR